ncbi:sensor histidine kinase [Ferruginibacter albus]|uniref:sensor histidine kinase n=1 Tax=Ferruginibacter albus TaxID=2875540 RepID=UPI001CC66E9A|nr:histidine kinase [Ferruginibacter albus]UAY53566.1 histidine kinase [Ferruginibacter albus]
MQEQIPFKKLFRTALITAPLFGLFGATPVMIFDIEFRHIPFAFVATTLITLFLWGLNIFLLWLSKRFPSFKTDWIRYAVSFVCCGLLIFFTFDILMPRPLFPLAPNPHWPPPPGDGFKRHRFGLHFIQPQSINIIIMIIIEMILLKDKKAQIEKENYQLKVNNLEAKHDFLKQQLHPHFLFNSLNTLKSLISRSPQQAEEYLIKLARLLRFSTDTHNQTLISLKEELQICYDYLTMQQVRFGEALHFSISVPDSQQEKGKVPVFSVLLLVENAVKHNIFTIAQPLNIAITGDEGNAKVFVINNLQAKNIEEEKGIGLANLAERYHLLGENDGVRVDKTPNEFIVMIKTFYYEDSYNRG